MPSFLPFEDDEETADPGHAPETDYEVPDHQWSAIPCEHASEEDLPVRFIDGSIKTRTAGTIRVGNRIRPLIAATTSAAALGMRGRQLERPTPPLVGSYLCLHSNGLDEREIREAAEALCRHGIELRHSEAEDLSSDFDTMRYQARAIAMGLMEGAEADLLLADASTPTLVDGLLERRLVRAPSLDIPAVGLVKRQIRHPLPPGLYDLVYGLQPGERTPAFVTTATSDEIALVSFYMRLSAPAATAPSYGIVRVSMTREYLERRRAPDRRWRYLSRLAGHLYRFRQRDTGYPRAAISVEPIVRVEDHTHAVQPAIHTLLAKVHRLMKGEA